MGGPADILAFREGNGWQFASRPFPASWSFEDLPSRDGHVFSGRARFSIVVPSSGIDQKALVETLSPIEPGRLTVNDAIAWLEQPLRGTATTALHDVDAIEASGADFARSLGASLLATAERTAFACGLEVRGPIELHLQSHTLTTQRAHERARTLAEADAARRVDHLRHAAELAKVVAETTAPAALLANTAAADRPATLAALLMSGADAGIRSLYAVAGTAALRIEPSEGFRVETLASTGDVGALRSVQLLAVDGQSAIGIGGQRGVSIQGASATTVYLDPDLASRLGFNAASYLPDAAEVWATHSERGIVRWRRADGSRPAATHDLTAHGSGHPGAQDLVAIDRSTMACSSGTQVFVATASEINSVYTGPADVVGLVVDGHRLHVVHADGTWTQLEVGTWRTISAQQTGGPVTAVAALPWVGGIRLLLARRDGGIDCLGVDDTLVSRYASRHIGFRAVTASAAHVAAITADRQRVILWHAADGREPVKEIHVASITGSRVAGICFG